MVIYENQIKPNQRAASYQRHPAVRIIENADSRIVRGPCGGHKKAG